MRGIIIEKFKDREIPAEFLGQALKKLNVRNAGFATVDKNEGLIPNFTKGAPTVEGIMAIQKALDGRGAVFMLGEYKDGTLDSDFQPAVLLSDEKDKPIVVGFLVGAYPGYDKNDSHTPEHHVASEYLFPKVDEYNNFLENNIDKLVEQCDRKLFTQEVRNLISGEGTVSLVFRNGKILHYFKTDKNREYPWGRVSDHLDWVTEGNAKADLAAQLAVAAGKASSSKTDDRSAPPKTETAIPTAATGDKGVQKFDNLLGGKEIPASIHSKYPLHFPPNTVQQFRDLRKWYKNKGGYHASEAEIKARIGVFAKSDLDKIRLEMASEKAKAEGSQKVQVHDEPKPKSVAEQLASAASQKQKDVTAKHIPEASTVREAAPFLTEDIMKAIKPSLDKLRDQAGNLLPTDPKAYHLLEAEAPSFSQKNGLKGLSLTFRWTYDDLVRLGQSVNERGQNVGIFALAHLIMEHRKANVEAWQKQAPAVEQTVQQKLEAAMRRAM